MANFDYDGLSRQSTTGWQKFCQGAMISGVVAIATFAIVLALTT